MIETLITGQDAFEIIRDQIALILVTEIANQQVLAAGAGEDPELWKVRIYKERGNAWEQYLNDPADTSPLCNIWCDGGNYLMGSSNTIKRQNAESVFNLDCYGYGKSGDDGAGHLAGDLLAVENTHRAYRLVRRILMASEYTHLGLRGTVFRRFPTNYTPFQREYNGAPVENVYAMRLVLSVSHDEFSPQQAEEVLEILNVKTYDRDGQTLLIESQYEV